MFLLGLISIFTDILMFQVDEIVGAEKETTVGRQDHGEDRTSIFSLPLHLNFTC
jgi:hypothetical protein